VRRTAPAATTALGSVPISPMTQFGKLVMNSTAFPDTASRRTSRSGAM
jgi:hypothetical protein